MAHINCRMLLLLAWLAPAHAKTEVFFVPNRGQAEPAVHFTVQSPHVTAWFLQTEIRFKIGEDELRFRLLGANGAARIESRNPLAGRANYIRGNNSQLWQRNIPIYQGVVYREIYDGIDMVYEGSRRQLKSSFVLKPGTDPSVIRFRYIGVEHLAIDADGALLLTLHSGTLREEAPEAYQQLGPNRRRVQSRFQVFPDQSIGFSVEEYDRTQTLTIDPPISCSTYLGGVGLDAGTAVANDSTGAVYVAGWTDSADLRTRNALRSSPAGVDAFVAKFSADGQTLVYCTYLGGNGDDRAYGIAVDGAGDAFITGWTGSTDFPVVSAYQTTLAGARDAFVAKLNPAGNGLVYSTYYGGKGYDSGNGIAIDATGIAYVAGETTSTDIPVHYAFQSSSHGGSDAFAIKLSAAGNGLVYATYLGGRADDRGRAIAIDSAGSAYLTGDTSSSDFPTLSAFQSVSGGNQDAFLAKLNSGGGLVYSSYLGGSGGIMGLPESGAGIAVDALGSAYVTGTTSSFDFPLLNALQTTHTGSQPDAFITKVSPNGASLIYSTYLGGSSVDVGSGVAVDSAGLAYVAGYTASSDFPSPVATDVVNHGGYDGFLVQLSADGKTLLQSMCFGGSSNDVVNALSVTASGVYLTGQTLSGNFPTVQALQGSFAGGIDSFLTKVSIPGSSLKFVAVTPCRIADTRNANGAFGGPAITGQTSRDFVISNSQCGIPSNAAAYSINVTAVPRGPLGYMTVYPAGHTLPVSSTLNSLDGRVKANAAILPAGANGSISVFATDTTDVVLDINGYFVPTTGSSALTFFPLPPCRIADTRNANGSLGGPFIAGGHSRSFPILSSACSVPATAQAYSLNFTAMPRGTLGYLTAYPTGSATPLVSTLNAIGGQVTANAAIVPAGANGSIDAFAANDTDLVVDINGYFAPSSGGGLSLYNVTPCRAVDTRNPSGSQPFNGTRTLNVSGSACTVPGAAQAYVFNATVVPPGPLGYLSLWPQGQSQPLVSTLNAPDGAVTSNMAITPTTSGSINAFVPNPSHLILDVTAYFVGSSRVDLQACKLEYSIVSPK